MSLFVIVAGDFVVTVEVLEIIFEDQEITFNCSAPGVGVVLYTWDRDGITIRTSSEAELTVTVPLSWNSSCLTCHVQADNGEEANASITLQVFSKNVEFHLT